MSKKSYTINQIEKHWAKYEKARVMKVMRGGKTELVEMKGAGIPRLQATRASIVNLSTVISFPEYLRKNGR